MKIKHKFLHKRERLFSSSCQPLMPELRNLVSTVGCRPRGLRWPTWHSWDSHNLGPSAVCSWDSHTCKEQPGKGWDIGSVSMLLPDSQAAPLGSALGYRSWNKMLGSEVVNRFWNVAVSPESSNPKLQPLHSERWRMGVRGFCQENLVTLYLAHKRSSLFQVFEDIETWRLHLEGLKKKK